MNAWIRRSIALAAANGYLDNLQQIYNVGAVEEREIPDEIIVAITRAYADRNAQAMVQQLLSLEKFPFDDTYVGYLRSDTGAIVRNPGTVRRIADRVFATRQEDLIRQCRQPKVGNRQMGELFQDWLVGLGYPQVPWETFAEVDSITGLDGREQRVLMMEGSRKKYKEFANTELDCGVEKELDLLLKVNGNYVIGEAKFFSGFGGHQDDNFRDAMNLLQSNRGDAVRIAVLDGVHWLDTGNMMSLRIRNTEAIAMSALLLSQFIAELQVTVE